MFRNPDETYKKNPPVTVIYDGFTRNFADLSREQWDELGYHEAMPAPREPYITYETRWVKGDDLIYREEIISDRLDETAKREAETKSSRNKRNSLLTASDWTQLADSTLDNEGMVLWQGYRQALRDVPQQTDFPLKIQWPQQPEVE